MNDRDSGDLSHTQCIYSYTCLDQTVLQVRPSPFRYSRITGPPKVVDRGLDPLQLEEKKQSGGHLDLGVDTQNRGLSVSSDLLVDYGYTE